MNSISRNSSASNNTGHQAVGQRYFSVVDVPFERNGRQAQMVFAVHRGQARQLENGLATLPPQRPGTARVFTLSAFDTDLGSSRRYKVLVQHLLQKYRDLKHRTGFIKGGFDRPFQTVDFGVVSSQWSQCTEQDPDSDEYATISTEMELISQDSESWLRRSSLMCLNHGGDQLLVINIKDRSQPEGPSRSTEDIFDPWEDVLTTHKSFTALGDGTKETCAKLLLLDFFAANIHLQSRAKLCAVTGEFPEANVVLNIPGRSSEWTMCDLDQYVDNIARHERTLDSLQNLADSIGFISESLPTKPQQQPSPSTSNFDRAQISMLQKLCNQRLGLVQRSMDRLNRALEARDKVNNIQESISVKRLTILATIFLPLSLSTSILSMQNRFVDLRVKLYDFVGVFVIVGTAAVLTLFLVRAALKLKSKEAFKRISPPKLWDKAKTFEDAGPKWSYRIESVRYAATYILAWAVVLTSFIVGMLKNVILGLKVLGYGFAGVLGFALLSWLLFWYDPIILIADRIQRRRWEEWRRKEQQKRADDRDV